MDKTNKEIAIENFRAGYNCAQSVILTYAEKLGLDQDLALSLTSTLGTGMGGLQQTCGAVTSMFIILGLVEGKLDSKNLEGKANLYRKVRTLAKEFEEKNKSIICKDLIAYTQTQEFKDGVEKSDTFVRPCEKFVKDIYDLIDEEIINNNL